MEISGFIPLNKPQGLSSQQAVNRLRKIIGSKKAGHTGTLDPRATGLLLVAVGKATRLCQYFLDGDKGYRAQIEFGVSTDTGDKEGQIISQSTDFNYSCAEINAVLKNFIGRIEQKPPAASAIRLNGKRAFTLFRQGMIPEMPSRQIEIKTLTNLTTTILSPTNPLLDLDIICSKGTYIRSLAVDIGASLGCPTHLANLIRTRVGQISLAQAATFADLERDYRPWLLDSTIAVEDMTHMEVGLEEARMLIRGQKLKRDSVDGEVAVFIRAQLLAIAHAKDNIIQPTKVFIQEQEL